MNEYLSHSCIDFSRQKLYTNEFNQIKSKAHLSCNIENCSKNYDFGATNYNKR